MKDFIQVHHFKWDSTCIERIKEVSKQKEYTFWEEYKKMYDSIKKTNFKIDIDNPTFGLVRNIPIQSEHWDYQYWNRLTKRNIKNLNYVNAKKTSVDTSSILEKEKLKRLEKNREFFGYLLLWFEEIDKDEWGPRIEWYLSMWKEKYIDEK